MKIKKKELKLLIENIVSETLGLRKNIKKPNNQVNEGIDFDRNSKQVWYTPSAEDYVDTSTKNNPTFRTDIIPGVKVWSIFKRKKGVKRGDGNPLIKALKNEGEWTFRSDEDKKLIEKQFDLIATKFAQLYPIGVTVVIPSGNPLNQYIADVVTSKSDNAKIIVGAVSKLTVDEVDEIVSKNDSEFRKYYGDEYDSAYEQLGTYFDEMDVERNGIFSRHKIYDKEMRNVLSKTLKLTKSRLARKSKFINGEDVLIIDDTMSRGQTIKDACRIIQESYSPKSITVLTLMSML